MAENQGHRYDRVHQVVTSLSVSFTELGLKSLEPIAHGVTDSTSSLADISEYLLLMNKGEYSGHVRFFTAETFC